MRNGWHYEWLLPGPQCWFICPCITYWSCVILKTTVEHLILFLEIWRWRRFLLLWTVYCSRGNQFVFDKWLSKLRNSLLLKKCSAICVTHSPGYLVRWIPARYPMKELLLLSLPACGNHSWRLSQNPFPFRAIQKTKISHCFFIELWEAIGPFCWLGHQSFQEPNRSYKLCATPCNTIGSVGVLGNDVPCPKAFKGPAWPNDHVCGPQVLRLPVDYSS